ncbi:MAG TPA: ATP-dependent zinc metalloprotease FtsH [Bacteroidales bacterium]|nr:MAG: ATP-dependent zinc metalloprotease FtsH 3 [Bacteroidetes bacterium ADurb.Bin139]HOG24776.1 ATP-dependent zinc metalloprotease FtsH [Bacteroidales bacterium]HOR10799.1 ATP-dependent zinc metalloprotease FtsH [Bacteroidales bacterium]HOZ19400.1 ATP-dependent zinc metalloprotease FtsH [Bacteroidales bacterium]HPB77488.1 ATP-dependent zinc metalloprotease FtsH [Bacteroidales bacterium]
MNGNFPNQKKSNKPPQLQIKKRINPFLWVYIILIGLIIYFMFSNRSGDPVKTEWITVKEQMGPKGEIEKIVYISNLQRAELYIKPDALEQYKVKFGDRVPKFAPQFYFIVTENFDAEVQFEQLRNSLPEELRFKVEIEQRSSYWGRIIEWLLLPVLLILMWVFMFRRMSRGPEGGAGGGGIFNVGRSQAKLFEKDKTVANVTFKDVAGLEEAKVEVMEIVDFLKNPGKYTSLGGKIPKGALLVGPPGTGKTLLAKAVAGEANVPFFSISGSDFVEMFVGVGASRVRDLFRQAKEKAPCIVFIDEIDAVGRARSKNTGFTSNDERENTLNQLLTEMDGFGSNSGVIILAATNRADVLDKALMRAGRFDRQIHVDLPELKERHEIFKVHSRGLKLEEGFDLAFLSKQTPGFSGADIANVCNEAALIAARKNKNAIQKQDFLDAIDRIVGGLERKSKIISPQEKRTIAFHESGHATVSWMLRHANPLLKVTIIPRGHALGAAWYLPEERQITTVEQMMDEMASALGGRAAEELMIGQISTGAMNDLEKVTRQAYAMVAYFGMSDKIGNVSFYDSTENAGFNLGKPYSETTAQLIDREVRRIIDQAYDTARQVLKEYKEGFLKLANQLLEKEVIFSDDLEAIFGKRQSAETLQVEAINPEETIEHAG